MLGNFTISLKDGQSSDINFTARFVVDEAEGKFRFVRVWTDGDMKEALRRAEETLGIMRKSES